MIEPGLREEAPTYPVSASGLTDHTSPAKTLWDHSNNTLQLQPAELLNKNAKTGKFSLQNVLSTATGSDQEDTGEDDMGHSSPENSFAYSVDDPIRSKILNFPIALGLFDR